MRWLVWAASMVVLPLLCVNLTAAGVIPEDYAEMAHGTINTLVSLWALRWLSISNRDSDTHPKGGDAKQGSVHG